ncbi:hypothetical protein ACFX13_044149 [Malus domestica]
MITGYGKHGLGKKSIYLFQMLSDDIEPNGVTYIAALSACSHSRLVEECQECFSRLCCDNRIKQNVEHYACMVDLLGRAIRVKEAKNLIDTMPLKPNVGIQQTLLSACRVHGDLEIDSSSIEGEELGSVHGVRFALHDVEEESKEERLRFHSEKLAIKLVLVVFLVKDANKFHKFEDDLCSCGDYW